MNELPPLPRRRVSDVVTLETLDTRVTALEEGYENVRLVLSTTVSELQSNTRLTEDVHGQSAAMVERMEAITPKIDRLYAVAEATDNIVRVVGKFADGVIWFSDLIEKRPKTLLLVGAAIAAAAGYFGLVPDSLFKLAKIFA
jgi:hypothetical protein